MALSANATKFMECLAQKYRESGETIFTFTTYMDIPNYSSAIEELIDKGYISWKDDTQNIVGSIVLNLDSLD